MVGAAWARLRSLSRGQSVPLWVFAIVRVYLGIGFLRAASNKIGSNWATWPGAMRFFVGLKLRHSYFFYRPFGEHVILKYVAVFAPLVAVTEVLVGVALLLGLGTRFACAAGLFLIVNYMLAFGETPLTAVNDAAFFWALLVVFLTDAGRVFGADYYVYRFGSHGPVAPV